MFPSSTTGAFRGARFFELPAMGSSDSYKKESVMKRSAAFVALLMVAGMAHAEDGLSLGVGVDYSSGDYGSETTTKILSVPLSAKYNTGDWSFKASLPWMRRRHRRTDLGHDIGHRRPAPVGYVCDPAAGCMGRRPHRQCESRHGR
jgi:hypothetical protein